MRIRNRRRDPAAVLAADLNDRREEEAGDELLEQGRPEGFVRAAAEELPVPMPMPRVPVRLDPADGLFLAPDIDAAFARIGEQFGVLRAIITKIEESQVPGLADQVSLQRARIGVMEQQLATARRLLRGYGAGPAVLDALRPPAQDAAEPEAPAGPRHLIRGAHMHGAFIDEHPAGERPDLK